MSTSQPRKQTGERSRISCVSGTIVHRIVPLRARWSGEKDFRGTSCSRPELPLPKGNASISMNLVASHADSICRSQENGAEIRRHVIASDAKFAAPTSASHRSESARADRPCL